MLPQEWNFCTPAPPILKSGVGGGGSSTLCPPPHSSAYGLQYIYMYTPERESSRGVARILGKGVLIMRVQILATHTYEMERSKFKLSQRMRSDGS